MTRHPNASQTVMPWERPIPTFQEYDGWRICDVCGVSWKANLPGFDFLREWRHHLYQHLRDTFPNVDDRP